jgi:hypothetical protein
MTGFEDELMAVVGHVDHISRRTIIGWAADDQHWERQVPIEIFVNGKSVGRTVAAEEREGLAGALPKGATGKYGFEFTFNPALSIFDNYQIAVNANGAAQPLPNGTKELRAPPRTQGSLIPIMVTATGRSGTTVLMQRLSSYPEVVMGQQYPYEMKLSNYYSAAFRVLTAETDRANSTNPDFLFSKECRYMIGSNPYTVLGLHGAKSSQRSIERFFEETVPAAYAKTFRSLILDYYNILMADQNKPAARYFVEKSALDETARMGPRLFFGNAREIVLVRDPRDMLCSMKAFWKSSFESAVQLVTDSSRRIEEISKEKRSDVIVVKYEDLVLRPEETINGIADFVGLSRVKSLDSGVENTLFGLHGTSASPASSIGRWRNDLNAQELEACERELGSFLERFGYATGALAAAKSA